MASFGDLNCFVGIGRLTRDPELRYTPSGKAICKFGLAINRSYKNQDGSNIEDTLFINISAWGRQAEHCSQFLKKGRRVAVNGELRSNNWQDRDGNKRVTYEISARSVQFLDYLKDLDGMSRDEFSKNNQYENESASRENQEDQGYQNSENAGEEDIPF